MIKELLPPSIAQSENIKALAEASDSVFQKLFAEVINAIILPRINEITDETLLDLLAWQFHIEGYELASSIEEKRNLIKSAIELHRYKGTKYAIKKVLESLNLEGKIEEWFQYNGEPYKFKVDLGIQDREITTELRDKLLQLINEYKNERSWLEEIILAYLSTGTINFAFGQTAEIEAFAECQTELEWTAEGSIPFAISAIAETEAIAIMEA